MWKNNFLKGFVKDKDEKVNKNEDFIYDKIPNVNFLQFVLIEKVV